MDKKFRVPNSNGGNNIWSTAEEIPTATSFRQQHQPQMQSSSSSASQFQPESSTHHRDLDLLTLESSFGRLSFTDPSVYQNRYNHLGGGGFSGGGGGGGYMYPPSVDSRHQRELELQRFGMMLNNGFLNGGVPYASRNRVYDQKPWDYMNGISSSWRSDEGFGGYNNQDPSSMRNGGSSLVNYARDRVYSKQLENKIRESTKETFDITFNDLVSHICGLMVDPFGSDVVRALMEKCDSQQITQIVDVVILHPSRFVNTCFDALGSNTISKLLELIQKECKDQIPRMLEAISIVALQLARSNNGKHVVVTCFTVFTFSQYRDLLEVVARNCYQIAIDQHGCCMLQQCLLKKAIELKQVLIGQIIANALKLCLNCYGNYVVQYVVDLDNGLVAPQLIMQLVGSYGYLARNKYGSHAVQKFLKISGIDTRVIVRDLLSEIDTLLLDPFGNYVIQTAWFVSQDDVRLALRWHIDRNIRLMRCNKFGNKILEKLNI